MAVIADSVSVDNRLKRPLLPPRSEREMIQPVILVQMIAPIIMDIACFIFIIPEFTKPTTITDVADED